MFPTQMTNPIIVTFNTNDLEESPDKNVQNNYLSMFKALREQLSILQENKLKGKNERR